MKHSESRGTRRSGFMFGLAVAMVFFFSIVFLVSPGVSQADKTVRISIATGGTGGVWYPYGGVMANVISKYLPNVEATAEVTAASVDNARLLGVQKADLAMMLGDVGFAAHEGQGMFKEKIPMRNLASLYASVTHVITKADKGINSVADLKGRRISTGAPGSATEVVACRVLEAYGIDPEKEVTRDRLSATESAGALKDGKIDAYFWVGGIPTASVMDLAATPGVKIALIDHGEAVPKLKAKYGPIYFKITCPANTYHGVDRDVNTVSAGNYLVCHEKMDKKLAYDIVKVLFDHLDELIAGHKIAKELTLQKAVMGSPIPYHPGAEQFYKEKGLKIEY